MTSEQTAVIEDRFAPRRYLVRHETAYEYSSEVSASLGRAKLRPRETDQQTVLEHRAEVTPTPAVHDEVLDPFGNFSHFLEITTGHQRLSIVKESLVRIDRRRPELERMNTITVAEARETIRQSNTVDPIERAAYVLPTELTDLGDARKYATDVLDERMPFGDAVRTVFERIYDDFTYESGVTNVNTTLPELIAAKAGVCQDFAHLAAAVSRSFGIPARYVSGYLETSPPPGQIKLRGSDASHAWCAVMTPDGQWIDIDPTNNQPVDSRYIITAWGRDFRDVSPYKGITTSAGATSTLSVSVDVDRVEDPATAGERTAP